MLNIPLNPSSTPVTPAELESMKAKAVRIKARVGMLRVLNPKSIEGNNQGARENYEEVLNEKSQEEETEKERMRRFFFGQ